MSTVITEAKTAGLARVTDPPALLVRDPICGKEFNPAGAAATRNVDGQTHYFCAEKCVAEFDAQPSDRATRASQDTTRTCH